MLRREVLVPDLATLAGTAAAPAAPRGRSASALQRGLCVLDDDSGQRRGPGVEHRRRGHRHGAVAFGLGRQGVTEFVITVAGHPSSAITIPL
jgi:hypothetical protein